MSVSQVDTHWLTVLQYVLCPHWACTAWTGVRVSNVELGAHVVPEPAVATSGFHVGFRKQSRQGRQTTIAYLSWRQRVCRP